MKAMFIQVHDSENNKTKILEESTLNITWRAFVKFIEIVEDTPLLNIMLATEGEEEDVVNSVRSTLSVLSLYKIDEFLDLLLMIFKDLKASELDNVIIESIPEALTSMAIQIRTMMLDSLLSDDNDEGGESNQNQSKQTFADVLFELIVNMATSLNTSLLQIMDSPAIDVLYSVKMLRRLSVARDSEGYGNIKGNKELIRKLIEQGVDLTGVDEVIERDGRIIMRRPQKDEPKPLSIR